MTLIDSTISGNTGRGPAVLNFNEDGAARLINATVSGNTVPGVSNNDGSLTVTNRTISGNGGPGVRNLYLGTVTITNTTISKNNRAGVLGDDSGAAITLSRRLVSGNAPYEVEGIGVYTSGFNLFGHKGLTHDQAFLEFTPGASDITLPPTALIPRLWPRSSIPGLPIIAGPPEPMP